MNRVIPKPSSTPAPVMENTNDAEKVHSTRVVSTAVVWICTSVVERPNGSSNIMGASNCARLTTRTYEPSINNVTFRIGACFFVFVAADGVSPKHAAADAQPDDGNDCEVVQRQVDVVGRQCNRPEDCGQPDEAGISEFVHARCRTRREAAAKSKYDLRAQRRLSRIHPMLQALPEEAMRQLPRIAHQHRDATDERAQGGSAHAEFGQAETAEDEAVDGQRGDDLAEQPDIQRDPGLADAVEVGGHRHVEYHHGAEERGELQEARLQGANCGWAVAQRGDHAEQR